MENNELYHNMLIFLEGPVYVSKKTKTKKPQKTCNTKPNIKMVKTSMSFPIFSQSAGVILEESRRGLYSLILYTTLFLFLDSLGWKKERTYLKYSNTLKFMKEKRTQTLKQALKVKQNFLFEPAKV